MDDAIQFSPLVWRLAQQADSILFEVPTPLVRLFRYNFSNITVIGRPNTPHAFSFTEPVDFAISLMSLPERLGLRIEDLPLSHDYLKSAPEDDAIWTDRLPRQEPLHVGVVWAGRPNQADNAKRSIPFGELKSLFDVEGIAWYSLQVGPQQSDPAEAGFLNIRNLSPNLTDFADTAAAIVRLDLVVSVCTGVAHLSAAMGKPTWLMARLPVDWRWAQKAEHSPWYPSMRIFRQRHIGEWGDVIGQIRASLEALVATMDFRRDNGPS